MKNRLDLLHNHCLLICEFVKNKIGILMYAFVHSGSSLIFSCSQTKIRGSARGLLHKGGALAVVFILGLLGGYKMYHKIKILTQALPECTDFPTTAYTYETLAYTAPKQAEWKASRSQDEEGLWVYGLFHGPCLVYDSEGALVQAYPIYFKKNPLAAEGFRLLQLEPLTYPFVFEGYYQAKVEAEYTFLLYDERSKKSFRLGLDEASDTQVQCVAFHSRQWDSQKQCLQDPVLEVWDSAFQKKFALPLQQKLLLDQFSIVVSHSETTCIQLSQVGDSAMLSKGVVCLKKVHPHCRAILLEYKEAQSPYSDYFLSFFMKRIVLFFIGLSSGFLFLPLEVFANSEDLASKERLHARAALLKKVDASWEIDSEPIAVCSSRARQNDTLLEKLNTLIVPKLQLSDMPLSRAIELLSELSIEVDPLKCGINMVLIDPQGLNPLVSLNLRNCSLQKILSFLSKCSQFAYEVHEDTLVFEHSPGSPLTLETEFFPLARATVIRLVDKDLEHDFLHKAERSLSILEEEEALKVFLQKAGIDFEHTPGSSLAFEGTQLIVTHTPRHLERLHNLLERYKDIKQVEIEARFLEVQEGVLEELGFRWSAQKGEKRIGTGSGAKDNLRSLSQAYAGQSTNGGEGRISVDGNVFPISNNLPSVPNALNLGSQAVPTANLMGVLNAWDLNVMIKALEQHGGSDLMSAPKLTVLSGKTAQIVVAQEFRYPESFGDIGSEVGSTNLNGGGSAGVSITAGTPRNFTVRNIGVEMEVTPTVEMNNYITLTLEPKVTEFEGFVEYGGSSIAVTGNTSVNVPSGFIQPIFSIRKIKTQFTIANGQIAVIGGLAREEVVKVQDKVPFLGDIPLLGRLFQSKSETSQKRNLIIFVSANLVSPNGQLYSAVP